MILRHLLTNLVVCMSTAPHIFGNILFLLELYIMGGSILFLIFLRLALDGWMDVDRGGVLM
jgi:hypothetical protein